MFVVTPMYDADYRLTWHQEIVAVTIGPKQNDDVLRTALAMGEMLLALNSFSSVNHALTCLGADRGVHVLHDGETQPLGVAKTLRAIIEKEKPVSSSENCGTVCS